LYPTQKIPAALAALTPLVLSSITMQLSLVQSKDLLRVQNMGCGFDCGKSSPYFMRK
jgi:hypothetical protein